MKETGFKRGAASPVVFHNRARNIKILVHGDDFLSSGSPVQLAWFKQQLESKYQIKTSMIGGEPEMAKQMKMLNRTLVWHDGVGISYEADEKHAKVIIKETAAEGMKALTIPIARESPESDKEKEKT